MQIEGIGRRIVVIAWAAIVALTAGCGGGNGNAGGSYRLVRSVADQPGLAPIADPDLKVAWSLALSPTGGGFWVTDFRTNVVTVYTGGTGGAPIAKSSLTVTVPGGGPTGEVYNPTTDFVMFSPSGSAPARFVIASSNGQISAWNPDIPGPAPSSTAVTMASVPGADYKALALGSFGGASYLYAADFFNNRIDVFDSTFLRIVPLGSFTDPTIPAGYAAFNVQNINGRLFVTYAYQNASRHWDIGGPHRGYIDVFDMAGHLLSRFASQGVLNSPWAMVVAPPGFGKYAGALLIANYGDGTIHAFDPNTGKHLGALADSAGKAIVIECVWGLAFGNGVSAGEKNFLYYAAGSPDHLHGYFGHIDPAP